MGPLRRSLSKTVSSSNRLRLGRKSVRSLDVIEMPGQPELRQHVARGLFDPLHFTAGGLQTVWRGACVDSVIEVLMNDAQRSADFLREGRLLARRMKSTVLSAAGDGPVFDLAFARGQRAT